MNEYLGCAYIIIEPNGTPNINHINANGRRCREDFIRGSSMSWRDCYKIGWRCKKVAVRMW